MMIKEVQVGYQQVVFPWIFISLFSEVLIFYVFTAPEKRPRDGYDVSDTCCSIVLGLLSIVIFKVEFFQWSWENSFTYYYTWETGFNYDNLVHRPLQKFYFGTTEADFKGGAANTGNPSDPMSSNMLLDENCFLTFFLCLLGADLQYYCTHRVSHVISWMWTAHMVHHSSEELNLATAIRGAFTLMFTPYLLINASPLFWFFPENFVIGCIAMVSIYPFWLHCATFPANAMVLDNIGTGEELEEKMKFVNYFGSKTDYIQYENRTFPQWRKNSFAHYFWYYYELYMNTPNLHRIHHCRNNDLLSLNYASMFCFWDRIFDTYCREQEVELIDVSGRSSSGSLKNFRNRENAPFYVRFFDTCALYAMWFVDADVEMKRKIKDESLENANFKSVENRPYGNILKKPESQTLSTSNSMQTTAASSSSTSIASRDTRSGSTNTGSGSESRSGRNSVSSQNVEQGSGGNNDSGENTTASENESERSSKSIIENDHDSPTFIARFKRTRDDLFYGTIPAVNTFCPWWLNWQPWDQMFFVQTRDYSQGIIEAWLTHWTPPVKDANGKVKGFKKCPKIGSKMNPTAKLTNGDMTQATLFGGAWENYELKQRKTENPDAAKPYTEPTKYRWFSLNEPRKIKKLGADITEPAVDVTEALPIEEKNVNADEETAVKNANSAKTAIARYVVFQVTILTLWAIFLLGCDSANILDGRYFTHNDWAVNPRWIFTGILNSAIFFLTIYSCGCVMWMLGDIQGTCNPNKDNETLSSALIRNNKNVNANFITTVMSNANKKIDISCENGSNENSSTTRQNKKFLDGRRLVLTEFIRTLLIVLVAGVVISFTSASGMIQPRDVPAGTPFMKMDAVKDADGNVIDDGGMSMPTLNGIEKPSTSLSKKLMGLHSMNNRAITSMVSTGGIQWAATARSTGAAVVPSIALLEKSENSVSSSTHGKDAMMKIFPYNDDVFTPLASMFTSLFSLHIVSFLLFSAALLYYA